MSTEDSDEWRDRANTAEAELSALRKGIREYVTNLRSMERGGPVTYRREVAADLEWILAA